MVEHWCLFVVSVLSQQLSMPSQSDARMSGFIFNRFYLVRIFSVAIEYLTKFVCQHIYTVYHIPVDRGYVLVSNS